MHKDGARIRRSKAMGWEVRHMIVRVRSMLHGHLADINTVAPSPQGIVPSGPHIAGEEAVVLGYQISLAWDTA